MRVICNGESARQPAVRFEQHSSFDGWTRKSLCLLVCRDVVEILEYDR
jgi:hypothetical protein